jgi:hypothetical protein
MVLRIAGSGLPIVVAEVAAFRVFDENRCLCFAVKFICLLQKA